MTHPTRPSRLTRRARLAWACAAACAAAFALAAPAHAQSDASKVLSVGSLWVSALGASAAVDSLGNSGQFVVTGLKAAGESTTVFLRDAGNATSQAGAASIEVSSSVLRAAGVAVGSSVVAVGEASGYALMTSGKMIAFIPNEIGRSLVGSNFTRER
jgi:hypothetical protein